MKKIVSLIIVGGLSILLCSCVGVQQTNSENMTTSQQDIKIENDKASKNTYKKKQYKTELGEFNTSLGEFKTSLGEFKTR